MQSIRRFLTRHRRKIFFTAGVLGSSYVLYRIYYAQKEKLLALEQREEAQRLADELVETQLREHFESLQNLSDSTSLSFALQSLNTHLSEQLDHTELIKRLNQGRGQMSSEEKLQLWEQLKILSFTKTACALWAMMVLTLYIRVQLNILGRHIFIEQAQQFENQESMDDSLSLWQHMFIGSSDYLHQYGVSDLTSQMKQVVEQILQSKSLKEPLTAEELADIFTRILETFSSRSPHWIQYVIPENGILFEELSAGTSTCNVSEFPPSVLSPFQTEQVKLEQLMAETRAILQSHDFWVILQQSMKAVLDSMVKEFHGTFEGNTSGAIPLAKLLASVAAASTIVLAHPMHNKYIKIIGDLPQVQSFYAFLYANIGALSK